MYFARSLCDGRSRRINIHEDYQKLYDIYISKEPRTKSELSAYQFIVDLARFSLFFWASFLPGASKNLTGCGARAERLRLEVDAAGCVDVEGSG